MGSSISKNPKLHESRVIRSSKHKEKGINDSNAQQSFDYNERITKIESTLDTMNQKINNIEEKFQKFEETILNEEQHQEKEPKGKLKQSQLSKSDVEKKKLRQKILQNSAIEELREIKRSNKWIKKLQEQRNKKKMKKNGH